MKIKHIILPLLLLAAAIPFSACGDEENEEPKEKENTTEQQQTDEENLTDVAVTSIVQDVGHNYVRLQGYVNLDQLPEGSKTVKVFAEFTNSFYESGDSYLGQDVTKEISGRAFSTRIEGIPPGTTYKYRTSVYADGTPYNGEWRTFETLPFEPAAGQTVDLGLSVDWANRNLGAESVWDVGDYFCWGSTEPWILNSINSYPDSLFAIPAGTDISGTEFDAAHVLWGGDWRLPTTDETAELLQQCVFSNYAEGFLATGPSGNTIYLPRGGSYQGYNQHFDEDHALLWAGTAWTDGMATGLALAERGSHREPLWGRATARNIRPVRNK